MSDLVVVISFAQIQIKDFNLIKIILHLPLKKIYIYYAASPLILFLTLSTYLFWHIICPYMKLFTLFRVAVYTGLLRMS